MLKVSSLLSLAMLLSIISFFTCGPLPTNPFEDPKNLDISIFLKGNKTTAPQNDSVSVGVAVNIPKLVKSLRAVQGDDSKEVFLSLNNPSSTNPDTVYFKTAYKTVGTKVITVKTVLSDNTPKDFTGEIEVQIPQMKIVFDSIPPKDTTVFTDRSTAFRIVSHTVPSTVINYTVKSIPTLDSNSLSITGSNSASVIFRPAKTGLYTLTILASNGLVTDSTNIKINVITKPQIIVNSPGNESHLGISDTLIFTGVATDSLTLARLESFKTGEVVVLPTTSKNVLKIVFTPTDAKVYSFLLDVNGVTTDGKQFNSVITIERTVLGESSSVWKQETFLLDVSENSSITKSLDSLLKNSSLSGITFSCDKGVINGSVWQDSVMWGSAEKDTVKILGNYNGTVSVMRLILNVIPKDLEGPQIALVYPAVSDAKVSAKSVTCSFTITDKLSGVGGVVFKTGSTILTDTLHSGDDYQCVVKNLVKGEKTTLTIEAYDKSMKKTVTTLNVSLTYDSEMADNVLPKIVMKSPSTTTTVVSTSETTIQVICTDESGIDTVTARKSSTPLKVERSDSLFSVVVTGLTSGKTDTIVFEATDGSPAKNKAPLSVYITYDPSSLDNKGPKIALKSPALNNAKVSSSSVTLSVICSDDNKVASVTYKTGTLSGNMTAENDSVFTATIIGLVSGKNQITVTAKDKSANANSTDSVFTVIYDQTISDSTGPIIVLKKSQNDSTVVVSSATASIEISCTDISGIDTVLCKMGTTSIPVARGTGDMFTATVSGLVLGSNKITFTATDDATTPHSTSKTVTIMYDPTIVDITPPTIALRNPAADKSKIATSSVTLTVLCKDNNGISAVNYIFGTTTAVMTKENDSTYSAVISSLKPGENQITVSAKDNTTIGNVNDTVFTVVYDPTLTDTTGPIITLKTPAVDSTKVSSKSLSVEITCTDTSGIDTVTCKMGTTEVLVVKGTGNTYTASVATLAAGVNTLTFTATDKASTKHSSTKSITVIYDPTMTDNVPPTVTLKNPLNADQRVLTDTITVQLECTDDNNILSVTASRAGTALTGITNVGSLYSVKLTALTAGKSDTVQFKVTDNSSNKVSKDFSVILRYNRKPSAATLVTPANIATGVIKKPAFTWSGGVDSDGDPVTYTLKYGTLETDLDKTVTNITAKTTTLTTNLNAATKYYWQVVTLTAGNGDSINSDILSFTTVEDAPVISADPVNQKVVLGDQGSFSVTATGLNLKYQWYKGNTAITGATATYTIPAVAAADDGSSFKCIVSNGGGSDTSTAATLTVTYGVTYNVNTGSGTAPVDANKYANGETVTVKAGTGLLKTNYTFGGWIRNGVANSKTYAANDTLKMSAGNLTLDAKWTVNNHTVTFDKNDAAASGSMAVQTIAEGASANLTANGFTKTGWTFAGWATSASGTAVYDNLESYTMGSANVILYAKWTAQTFDITFNKNDIGASGTMTNQAIASGSSALLKTNTYQKAGWTFAGWATSSSGSATVAFANQANYTMGTAPVTLYAKWTANNYTVAFYKNNSDVYTSMSNQIIACGSTVNLKANTYADGCRTFIGWASSPSGSPEYSNQGSYTMGPSNDTLYAIWEVTPLTVTPALGQLVEHCIINPITINTPCVVSYEWHRDVWGVDQIIEPGNSSFSGVGTSTLTFLSPEGTDIYCIITDVAGRKVTSGTWRVGSAYCP